jgi:hypothetical protein
LAEFTSCCSLVRVDRHRTLAATDTEVVPGGEGLLDIGGIGGILTLQLFKGHGFLQLRAAWIAKDESV